MVETTNSKIDAWIAEHVMGWTKRPWPDETGYDTNSGYRPSFRPTADAADAMTVFKKCHDRLDCEDIAVGRCDGMEWAGGDWYLYSIFRENRSEVGQWRVNGPTLELAICLFARKLFEKKRKTG